MLPAATCFANSGPNGYLGGGLGAANKTSQVANEPEGRQQPLTDSVYVGTQ
jgi:hypothetical protein